jgi:hypothetical protein
VRSDASEAKSATTSPSFSEFLANGRCRPRSRYHALTERTRNAPACQAPSTVWVRRSTLDGLKTITQKSVISARTWGGVPTRWKPAGVCIQELATTIQTALKCAPRQTITVPRKCTRGPTRSQPNSSSARKPDSRKKAKIPSAASALPKTSPTKRENAAQFVPNSNSMTMPVATPIANVRPKMRTQKRVICCQSGSRVRR